VVAVGWSVVHFAGPLRATWQRLVTHRKSVAPPMTRPAPASPETARH